MAEKLTYDQTAATYAGAFALSKLVGEGKNKTREFQKNVDYVGFALQEVIPDAPPYALVAKEVGEGEHKKTVMVPQYESAPVQYLMDAYDARVQAAAKGRVASGNEPYSTMQEILESTGGGQYKKLFSEFKASMVAYMGVREIPDALQAAVVRLLEPEVLKATANANKEKVAKLVGDFEEANPEHGLKLASVIKRVKEAASTEAAELDLTGL